MSWGPIQLRLKGSRQVEFDGEASPAPGGGSMPIGHVLLEALSPLVLGNAPSYVRLSPDGATAYAVVQGVTGVYVIDTASLTLVDTIDLSGSSPQLNGPLAVSPDGSLIAVPYLDDGSGSASGLAIIDTATNTLLHEITGIGVLGDAYWAEFSPDSQTIYLALDTSEDVLFIDAATYATLETASTSGNGAQALAVSPDGATIYCVNGAGAMTTVSVVDVATHTETDLIDLDPDQGGIVAIATATRLYVLNTNTLSVTVLDTATLEILGRATVPAAAYPTDFALAADGKHLYVADTQISAVSVIDTETLIVETFATSLTPFSVAVADKVYIADTGAPSLAPLVSVPFDTP